MMTVAVIVAGLLPVMFSDGTGSEAMKRIASPLVGRHADGAAAFTRPVCLG
jgi:Cu/Ag efflux pump CusA